MSEQPQSRFGRGRQKTGCGFVPLLTGTNRPEMRLDYHKTNNEYPSLFSFGKYPQKEDFQNSNNEWWVRMAVTGKEAEKGFAGKDRGWLMGRLTFVKGD